MTADPQQVQEAREPMTELNGERLIAQLDATPETCGDGGHRIRVVLDRPISTE